MGVHYLTTLSTKAKKNMTEDSTYTPPAVWQWDSDNGGAFANINRPTAGATHEKVLPSGKHPIQLYSLATPNGVKISTMLEELLALGHAGAEYDAWLINIGEGEQFGSGFVDINPNSKIPVIVDTSVTPSQRVFESASILLYLADKFSAFLPSDAAARTECMSWLFWLESSTSYLGGGFGHFYSYAPTKIKYCIDRYAMESKRQLDVLDRQLSQHQYIAGNEYTIVDMAVWPWFGSLALNGVYEAAEFLDTASYKHVVRWAKEIESRPAVQRGKMVNKSWGPPEQQLRERHDASDFELRTQDKLET